MPARASNVAPATGRRVRRRARAAAVPIDGPLGPRRGDAGQVPPGRGSAARVAVDAPPALWGAVAASLAPHLVLVLPVLLLAGCQPRRLDDRTTAPLLPASALEVVADLPHPPGNIAVSDAGRVFFTYHPDGDPPVDVVELVDGTVVPYPPRGGVEFDTVLSLRVDRQNRLWTLDYARYGMGQTRLTAFDLATDQVVQSYDFPSDVAGFPSMLNDFGVSPDGRHIYIAEASPVWNTPAIVVYDVEARTSRRLLHRHPALMPMDFVLQAPGRDMWVYGLVPLRIGVDSIALDRRGEWLYFGPLTGDRLSRIATRDLLDASLSPDALATRVEDWAPKPISDGITTDDAGRIYLSDPEHSAILVIGPDRTLATLVKDDRLRWPDGFSFGPGGWLYVTCSSLHHVLFVSAGHRDQHAPYQIFRLQPGAAAAPGQ